MRHLILATGLVASLTLAACGGSETTPPDPVAATPPPAETPPQATSPIEAAVTSDLRPAADKLRDASRHPVETLEFFEIAPGDTVMEIWPGGGWYTRILAPLVKEDGQYIAAVFDRDANDFFARSVANFEQTFLANPEIWGDMTLTIFKAETGADFPQGTVDTVVTFRNTHNWIMNGFGEAAFENIYAALKPGGILGVVQHRAPSGEPQDPEARTGYVHEDFVKELAREAGFEFVASSEINANPKDTADHPFGVWTLPPRSQTTDGDGTTPDGFDPAVYQAIGESDRMTLKFRKPESEPVSE